MERKDEQDSDKLRSIFPVEVWSLVLNQIRNTTGYQPICASSTFLKSELQKSKLRIMLPDVIKILLYKTNLFCKPEDNREDNPRNELVFNNILKLRLVCTTWRNEIDKVLHHLKNPEYSHLCPKFQNGPEMENKFRRYKDQFPGNPFLARAVCMSVREDLGNLSLYYPELLKMLSIFGHHIWYLKMDMGIDQKENQIEFVHKLGEILSLMPNLRKVTFIFVCEFLDDPEIPVGKFPTLKDLKVIQLLGRPFMDFHTLIQSNSQASDLKCHLVTTNILTTCFEKMSNLKTLSVDLRDPNHLETLRSCNIACIKLKYLTIKFMEMDVACENVFSVISSKFGDTLEYVGIDIQSKNANVGSSTLRLPKLKCLSIKMPHPLVLDFILPLRENLERLRIEVFEFKNVDHDLQASDGVIKIFQHWDNIYRSNIWEIFGRLKVLFIHRTGMRRDRYNRHEWKSVSIPQ